MLLNKGFNDFLSETFFFINKIKLHYILRSITKLSLYFFVNTKQNTLKHVMI